MKEIKNREAVIEQVAEMLVQFNIEMNSYDTDIYAYYDEKTSEVTLDTFVNIGGNSYLDDDHITIYTDKPHYENELDSYETIGELAFALDKTEEQLLEETVEYLISEKEYEDVNKEDITYVDVRDYIDDKNELKKIILASYREAIRYNDFDIDYLGQAEEIINRLEERLNLSPWWV